MAKSRIPRGAFCALLSLFVVLFAAAAIASALLGGAPSDGGVFPSEGADLGADGPTGLASAHARGNPFVAGNGVVIDPEAHKNLGETQGHTWCTPTPCTFPSVHC